MLMISATTDFVSRLFSRKIGEIHILFEVSRLGGDDIAGHDEVDLVLQLQLGLLLPHVLVYPTLQHICSPVTKGGRSANMFRKSAKLRNYLLICGHSANVAICGLRTTYFWGFTWHFVV
jgi:hypothetical protein